MNKIKYSFFELLPIVADQQWKVDKFGYIRNERNQCPVCAIVNEIVGMPYFTVQAYSAVSSLGIANYLTDAEQIVFAADFGNHSRRSELKSALGIK